MVYSAYFFTTFLSTTHLAIYWKKITSITTVQAKKLKHYLQGSKFGLISTKLFANEAKNRE